MGAYMRILRQIHPDGIMMINLKTGVATRFRIPAYKRINFGSSKLVKNFIKAW